MQSEERQQNTTAVAALTTATTVTLNRPTPERPRPRYSGNKGRADGPEDGPQPTTTVLHRRAGLEVGVADDERG